MIDTLATAFRVTLLAAAALAVGGSVAAQRPALAGEARACDGDTITAIDVRSLPPTAIKGLATSWGGVADVFGLHFAATRPEVITAYLLLVAGRPCTERDRSESERTLRLQPYLSSAAVRAVPDGPGRVRVVVSTVDELPIIVGVRMRGLTPVHVTLGSQNVGGRALTAALTTQRGDGYRPGIGLRLVQYAALGRPYTATASARRNPLGGAWALELAHPFLTDREPVAFHVGAQASREYYPVVTPVQGDLAISVRRASFNVGAVTRVGQGDVTGAVGGALLGENVRTAGGPVIVSDSGLVPVPADSGLAGRLQAFRVVRLAGIGGVRALRFVTVRGFDALTAEQDMGEGVQFAALAGPSMLSSTIRRDVFLSTDLYAGIGDARSFVSVRVIGEGRANRTTHRWSNVVTDARLVWYAMPMDRTTQVVNVDFSGVQALVYPLQLTFRDRDGGLRGYPDATFAGGRRAVLRIEERRLLPPLGRRADVAVSAFADAGRLWAGDVPYGVTTGMHTALGVSLQAAVPIGGKRTYRLDIALPLNRLPGSARWELRFTSADRAQTLWHEPADLVRARAGGIPANLLNWLSR